MAQIGGGTSVALCARGLKNEPIWPFSWYPPEKQEKILQLSLLPHLSCVSALLKACYYNISTWIHIFSVFKDFYWFLMVFDGF